MRVQLGPILNTVAGLRPDSQKDRTQGSEKYPPRAKPAQEQTEAWPGGVAGVIERSSANGSRQVGNPSVIGCKEDMFSEFALRGTAGRYAEDGVGQGSEPTPLQSSDGPHDQGFRIFVDGT